VGGLSLLLAFFALQLLPINYAGLLLILLGIGLLVLEINVTSYGLLTLGGAISLIFGSLMLIDSPAPELQLNLRFVLPIVVAFVAIGALLAKLGLSAQHQRPATGAEGMVGLSAVSLTPIGPDAPGSVRVHGEIWSATSAASIPEGAHVRVTGVDGLTLTVRHE
jgi:membrane-bound serine protease (ClpP class)